VKFQAIADVRLGKDVTIFEFVTLYGCEIGDETPNRRVRRDPARRQGRPPRQGLSHTFICEGVELEIVFVGHGVIFTNDLYPRAVTSAGRLRRIATGSADHRPPQRVDRIGLDHPVRHRDRRGRHRRGGQRGDGDVPAGTIVAGNPARVLRKIRESVGRPSSRADHRRRADWLPYRRCARRRRRAGDCRPRQLFARQPENLHRVPAPAAASSRRHP
jgi:hypothetical protein